MQPKVSVVIAAYNTEAYIEKAIASALEQTYESVEVIVVDDGSSDRTVSIVKGFHDERIKLVENLNNIGPGGTRNVAIAHAEGEWIAILDSDDWFSLDRLERLMTFAHTENADIVADDLYLIEDGDDHPWSTLYAESRMKLDKINLISPTFFVETDIFGKRGLHLGLSKPIFKLDFIKKNKIRYIENLTIAEDFWFCLDCLIHGAHFVFVTEPHYFYRSREGSLVKQDKLFRLDQYCKVSRHYLENQLVEDNPLLLAALLKNIRVFEEQRSYSRIVRFVQKGKFLRALNESYRYPLFLLHFFTKLLESAWRRLRHLFYYIKHCLILS